MCCTITIIFLGCKTTSTEPVQSVPGSFKELTADASFDWKTVKAITIQVQGFETIDQVSRALTIYDAAGNVLYKQAMVLSETVEISLEVPSPTTTLIVKYGNILRAAELSGNTAAVSLATPDDYQY